MAVLAPAGVGMRDVDPADPLPGCDGVARGPRYDGEEQGQEDGDGVQAYGGRHDLGSIRADEAVRVGCVRARGSLRRHGRGGRIWPLAGSGGNLSLPLRDPGDGMTDPQHPEPTLTYGDYLAVEELVALQRPRSDGPEHDELLFIVIHQVYELWFKQILHEGDYACRLLDAGDGQRTGHTLKRILTILKVLVGQLDVLETMTPLEFDSFRSRLDAASGFQSDQFRQLEFMLGKKESDLHERFPEGSRGRAALERRLDRPSLWDTFLRYLHREGHTMPAEVLARDVRLPIEANEAVQDALLRVYHEDPKNAQLCERFVDFDEGIQEWRYRHVKMVQRTIGMKRGTGGSDGAHFLIRSLLTPVFPDLWEIRTRL